MEMTFYDDSQFRSAKSSEGGKSSALKRPAFLDLDSPGASLAKRQRFTAILTSPDLNMLKLASPELEKLIMANGNLTTTPTPTQILFPKSVTEEQENYARGFIDALNHLHQTTTDFDVLPTTTITFSRSGDSQNSGPGGSRTAMVPINLSSPTSVIRTLSSSRHSTAQAALRPPSVENTSSNSSFMPSSNPLEISVKEEYQTVPSEYSSPPMSPISRTPIDMEDQERIKLERKRYRNRIAASKCRRRKLEKIAQLEDKVKELKNENAKLEVFADRLREQVYSLKQTVVEHVKKGCQIMVHQHL